MRKLITGIVEFREHRLPQYAEQFSKLALGREYCRVRRSECGAAQAVYARNPKTHTPNLHEWFYCANNAAFRLEYEGPLDGSLKPHDQLSKINVLTQLEHLMTYPVVRQQVTAGALVLSGWWFDIAAGSNVRV